MIKYLSDNYEADKVEVTLVNYDDNFLNTPEIIKNLRIKKMSQNFFKKRKKKECSLCQHQM